MEQYQLKLFGKRTSAGGERTPAGDFDFTALDNLAAVEHAKAAFAASMPPAEYAVLRQRDVGVIWEDYNEQTVEHRWIDAPASRSG